MAKPKKCSQCGDEATTYVSVWYYCATCWVNKYAPKEWQHNTRHVRTDDGHVRWSKSPRS